MNNEAQLKQPILPPFDAKSAALKVRMIEDTWNSRDPEKVSLTCTLDSEWRNRSELISGREAIILFLTRKWTKEREYRSVKELWITQNNRIAVRFAYEWHNIDGKWFRSYGNENWEFDEHGFMKRQIASINDHPIKENERKLLWPLGPRPDDHPGLFELGF